MATDKGIVFTLLWGGEGTYAMQFAVGGELITASSQYLVPIGLMTNIPDNAIVGRMKT